MGAIKVVKVQAELPQLTPYIPSQRAQVLAEYGDALQTRHLAEPRCWILAADWQATLWLEGEGQWRVTGKRGGTTDLASIPSLLEWLYKRDDRDTLTAALIHDAMYAINFPAWETANRIFHQVMRLEGAGRVKASLKYAAVRTRIARCAYEDTDTNYERGWWHVRQVVG